MCIDGVLMVAWVCVAVHCDGVLMGFTYMLNTRTCSTHVHTGVCGDWVIGGRGGVPAAVESGEALARQIAAQRGAGVHEADGFSVGLHARFGALRGADTLGLVEMDTKPLPKEYASRGHKQTKMRNKKHLTYN